jgi:hypothetical protein
VIFDEAIFDKVIFDEVIFDKVIFDEVMPSVIFNQKYDFWQSDF